MTLLDYMEAYQLLDKYGIKSVESRYVKDADDAVDFSRNKRIVLKVMSQKAVHKSRSGLVALDLGTEKDIREAYSLLANRARSFSPYKILAQHMVNKGIEMIIGGNTDQQFGKLVLIGLGGIYVETFKDVAARVCPINRYDAKSMLMQLKSHDIIAPNQRTENMIIELLLKTSKMFLTTNISELDLNPVIVYDNGYEAVDIRMVK